MITDHPFVGKREWGIHVSDDKPCQHTGCGMPKNQHSRACPSVLMIRGEDFPCDLVTPHNGWAHSNKAAEAIWK